MNQWEIYSEGSSDEGYGFQESFIFTDDIEILEKRNSKTLDSVLPTRGWPEAELSEVNCRDSESVLQLLLPTLAKLSAQNRWITLISPPSEINQKLFAYYGIDPSRVLLIHPKNDVDDKVTMNKALKNGTSGIVILWATNLHTRFLAQWRKSVKQGNSTGIIVNLGRDENTSESIAISIDVHTNERSLSVDRVKLFGVLHNEHEEILFSKVDLDMLPRRRDSNNRYPKHMN